MKKTTFLLMLLAFAGTQMVQAQKPNITVAKFRDSALASVWCPYDTTLVAYNLLQLNGYYGIYMANVGPGNTLVGEHCFTCGIKTLPGKNTAQPIFHPSGKYLLYMAEDSTHAGASTNSIPGIGLYNNLYVSSMDGKKTYQLTHVADTGVSAMIEPAFSPDGKLVMWDQLTAPAKLSNIKQEFGFWVIKTAPFVTSDTLRGPYIDSSRIRVYQPGGVDAFNESYGWSPDGSRIIFASDYNQFWVWDDQIYTVDTSGNNLMQMTSTAHDYPYTEHAFYSTDGKHIVWMTDEDAKTGSSVGGDDWWIMNADTTDQMRLTYFNDTTSSYWTGTVHVNCHGSFCPGRNKFIGDVTGSEPVQVNPALSIGAAYIITLNYLDEATAVNNFAGNINVKLFPNPATNFINVQVSNYTSPLHYSVYDMLGNKLTDADATRSRTSINVGHFCAGVYFIKVVGDRVNVNEKFVVEK